MSKANAQYSAILFDGYDLSGRMRQFDIDLSYIEEDATCFQDGAVNGQAGQQDFTVTTVSFMDPDTDNSWDALKTPGGTTPKALMVLMGNGAVPDEGDPGFAGTVNQYQINLPAQVRGKLTLEATFRGGSVYEGVLGRVLDYATITNTKTGDGIDQAAANAGGLAAYLIVFTPASTDTYTIKVQHSTDDVTYADYATFTLDGKARGGERIASTNSVNRYWRVLATRTGAAGDSFGFAVLAAKQ